MILLIVILILIVAVCSCISSSNNRETYQNNICADYYISSNYPDLDPNGLNVLDDLETVSYKDNDPNTINKNNLHPGQQVNACLIPNDLFSRYNLDSTCLLKDADNNDTNQYQLTPILNDGVLQQTGCMLRFSDFDNSGQPYYDPNDAVKFPDLLKIAYLNKDRDNRRAVTIAQNTLNNTLNNRNSQKSLLENTISNLKTSEYTNNQLNTQDSTVLNQYNTSKNTLKDLNTQISLKKDISDSMTSDLFVEQNSKIYNVETDPMKISKTFIINNAVNKYYVLWKYNSRNAINRNTDPHILWTGGYANYVNENINCDDPNLIFNPTNNYSYRNGDLINTIFSSKNQYYIIIEVYNKKGDNPICWIKFIVDTLHDNISNWFVGKNLVDTNITGLFTQKDNCNIFNGTAGHDAWKRRFFINLAYQGCNLDPGFFGIPFSNICDWDNRYHGYIITSKSGARYFGASDQTSINNIKNYDLGSSMIIYASPK